MIDEERELAIKRRKNKLREEQARQRENLSIQGKAKKISRSGTELVSLKKNSSGR